MVLIIRHEQDSSDLVVNLVNKGKDRLNRMMFEQNKKLSYNLLQFLGILIFP